LTVTLRAATPDNIPPGAVFVQGTCAALHLSLWFRDADETMRCLSMTARGLRCEQEFIEPAWFVPPASNAQVIGDLCDAAERFWLKNGRRSVPFGLDLRGISLLPDTTLSVEGAGGLTCATLIVLLFEHINAPLFRREEWERTPSEQRRRDDERAWQRINPPSRSSSDRTRATPHKLTTHRLRPEEVAAASGLRDRPVGFDHATIAGQDVLNQLPS
jgi:hypothetical protein